MSDEQWAALQATQLAFAFLTTATLVGACVRSPHCAAALLTSLHATLLFAPTLLADGFSHAVTRFDDMTARPAQQAAPQQGQQGPKTPQGPGQFAAAAAGAESPSP